MVTQNKTERAASYSTSKDLRDEIHNLVNDVSDREDPEIRSLATNIHFDIQDDATVLTEATDELIMILCSATFRGEHELGDEQRAVVAHAAELARLVDDCMRDDTGINKPDMIYYARELSKKRKDVGLIHYEDICRE